MPTAWGTELMQGRMTTQVDYTTRDITCTAASSARSSFRSPANAFICVPLLYPQILISVFISGGTARLKIATYPSWLRRIPISARRT